MVCLAASLPLWAWGCLRSVALPPQPSLSYRTRPAHPGLGVPQRPPTARIVPPSTGEHAFDAWKPESPERSWRSIVIHHTGTDWGNVESIHQAHLKRKDKSGRHWLGIGYHFVIGNGHGMSDGQIEPTFRWREQLQGAHAGVAEYNEYGIGIALIGNFEKSPPTAKQLTAVKRLVSVLARRYGIDSRHVVGHSDIKATACPGKLFPMDEVRQSVLFTWSGGRRSAPAALHVASLKGTHQP
ncbi:MAG TPA: N-acetylmuramoyl-L-alanine amidase [Planctomycetaceae bacterium]|nr:N-acetylmuramoyl-L-alanine amidase [Planctomycetaceae bacterium]